MTGPQEEVWGYRRILKMRYMNVVRENMKLAGATKADAEDSRRRKLICCGRFWWEQLKVENKRGRQALKGTWVFCSQTCCLMGLTLERVSVNSVLCLSQHGPEQYRCRVEIWNWDGQEIVGKNKTNKHTKKKHCFVTICWCHVTLSSLEVI